MSNLNKDDLIQNQATHITYLLKELANTHKENRTLKAALTRQTIEAGKTFKELRNQFDQLAQELHDILVHWTAFLQRALTYDEIIKYYRIKHPKTQYTSETICRRIREMVEAGLLHSPVRGTFIPIPSP